LSEQELGRALLPVFLGLGQMMIPPNMVVRLQMMMSPKMNTLCSHNRMTENTENVTNLNIQQVPKRVTLPTYNMIIKYFKRKLSK
jgi:hypothetical protein